MSTGIASPRMSAGLALKRAGERFGYEVVGADLSQPVDGGTFGQIAKLFDEEGLIVFRGQRLTPEQHIAFSRRFGELEIHFLKQFLHPRYPELLVVSNIVENGKAIGQADAGHAWHTDLSYVAEPSRGSLIYSIEIPHKDGAPVGDTLFASTACGYDALSDAMKRRLEGCKAVHAFSARYRHSEKSGAKKVEFTAEQKTRAGEVVHPVVRRHPVTGRKCIYVNEVLTLRIVGLPGDESDGLLKELCAHCIRPEFVYRHKWQVGDLVMWDNCSMQHCAIADYALPQRRWLQKTTLKGTAPS